MKILIVEDDPFVAEDLKDKLEHLQYRVVGVAESFYVALEEIAKQKPDLALLDIELKGELTGIDLALELGKHEIPFIFLTSVQDLNTYYKAKETRPLKNLAKPIDLVNLRNALLDIASLTSQKTEKVEQKSEIIHFFTDKDGIRRRVETDQIVYLESARSYCDVYLADESRITLSTAMGNVAKKLNQPDLIQISRFHFINKKHIQLIRGNEVRLTLGPFLKVTESFKDDFNRLVNVI